MGLIGVNSLSGIESVISSRTGFSCSLPSQFCLGTYELHCRNFVRSMVAFPLKLPMVSALTAKEGLRVFV